MDKAGKKAARAAMDRFQAEVSAAKTLSALAEVRVRFAEQLAAALPMSDDDRLELVNALLGREDPKPVQGGRRAG